MKRQILLLTLPLTLSSCLPEVADTNSEPKGPSEEQLRIESDRITRLETELHEMRLLFTNQIQRIEQVAASADNRRPASAPQNQNPPPQVVIMPQTPVVTHRWDQEEPPAPVYREPTQPARSRSYQVQPGDTLSEIAERYQVPLASVLSANSGIDPRRIRPGQSITLPGSNHTARVNSPRNNSGTYRVQSGDTLSEIAAQYGVSLQSLVDSNPGIEPDRLRIGKSLSIPSRGGNRTQARSSQATRFSSPPTDSLYTEPDTEPSPQPAVANRPTLEPVPLPLPTSAPPTPEQRTPSKKVLVRIPYNKSLGEIAQECGTDVATLNRINNSLLSPESRVKANTTIFVPVYEDSPTGS